MRQLINSPTRFTLTTSTLIDVMFSTEHESHIVTGVYTISLGDHYMTYTVYSKIARKTCLHKETMFRNYKRYTIDSCLKTTLYIILAGLRIHLLTSGMIVTMFNDISNSCAPMETRRLKHRNNPWMNSHIIELIYKRDYLKRKTIK